MNFPARVAIAAILLGPIIFAASAYIGLIADGTFQPPDLKALAQAIVPVATGGFAFAVGLAIIVIVVCAAIAPIIYSVRSGDPLTVLISLVLTTASIGVFVSAKSSIQEILAVLIYLSNTVLASIVYAAHRIARTT